jgi:DNA-binding transcriptional regulator PaaX
MTHTAEAAASPDHTSAKSLQAKSPPKTVLVRKLLQRGKGATLGELQEATSWQAHSTRAFLSRMRKNGDPLTKERRKSGQTAYRLTTKKAFSTNA